MDEAIIVGMNNNFLTASQVARHLGLSSERVRQLADRGDLPSLRTPLGRLFARTDVERLASKRRGSHPSQQKRDQ